MNVTLPVSNGASSALALPATGLLYVQAPGHPRAAVAARLALLGEHTTLAADAGEALRLLVDHRFEICLVDLASDRTALTAIRLIRSRNAHLPLVGIVNTAMPAVVAEAMHAGIAELLPWPFQEEDIIRVLSAVRERVVVRRRDDAPEPLRADVLFVQSPAMRELMDRVRQEAAGRQGVALWGEPCSGRGLVARTIQGLASGGNAPFVVVDCAIQPVSALERQLFGNTSASVGDGADDPRARTVTAHSAVHRAVGGTLFLRNLPDAPDRVQARLARLLEEHEVVLTEDAAAVDIDLRLMASFDATPGPEGAGGVRGDLAAWMPVRIDVPPFEHRPEDLPLLSWHFLDRACRKQNVPAKSFSRAALTLLAALPWPGNATALDGLLQSIARDVVRPVVQLEDVLEHTSVTALTSTARESGLTLREARARFERDYISAALTRHHGRVGEAARALGVQRTNLYRKVRQLKVPRASSTRR